MMLSQSKNRVQAIKSKFENLNVESEPLVLRKKNFEHLCKQNYNGVCEANFDKENTTLPFRDKTDEAYNEDITPNNSYLYNSEVKCDFKKTLTRQTSDPGKKLHRSHAFRCDRSQKIGDSPKRHGSCYGRSESTDFTLKMGDRKLNKDRLKRLGFLLEDQMRKENFQVSKDSKIIVGEVVDVCNVNVINTQENSLSNNNCVPYNSIPNSEVPKHILDQYAMVIKRRKNEADKQDAMTDSGVSSETENLDEDRSGRTKKLVSQFEKTDETQPADTNLDLMNNLCVSSETMRLERKNPHLLLTDTLKKALKQPLPPGPPPKKPPRTFGTPPTPDKDRKDPKKMLAKLEQHLQKRQQQHSSKNIYDIAETDLSMDKPKEIHYLCTEILEIPKRALPNYKGISTNCFNNLNCAMLTNSTTSLPYTPLSSSNCCTCRKDSPESSGKVSTFLTDSDNKCAKCQINDDKQDRFKCHLNCKCDRSEFYIENEHIYDEPYVGTDTSSRDIKKKNEYGTLNSSVINKKFSKSLEDLRPTKTVAEKQIYDIPCDMTTSKLNTTHSLLSDFERLRSNFENGFRNTVIDVKLKDTTPEIKKTEKPVPLTPKPDFVFTKNRFSKSSENLTDDLKPVKRNAGRKFGTEKRYRNRCETNTNIRMSLPKKDSMQLDIDRENLNRLMNEIYDTVTAVCNMDDHKPGSFPTESDGSTSEESVKITRSLTEKRKNYVRRVSSRVAYLDQKSINSRRYRHQTSICSYKSDVDNPYSTFRSWKSFCASQNNLAKDKMNESDSKNNLTDASGNALSMDYSDDSPDNVSIDEKTGCVDIDLPFETRDKGLFNISLLVGLNYMTGEAYVKSVFPSQVHVPPHIENLIFPETLSWASNGEWSADAKAQCYSLVLTDERGERSYGYCRRVLPEGATTCLPLCYCIIGKYRAPGFYYKVLQEIESHHGSSETEIQSILQQLFDTDFPSPGEEISITYTNGRRRSIEMDAVKCKTMPDLRRSAGRGEGQVLDKSESLGVDLPLYLDLENNNEVKSGHQSPRPKILKYPIEPRIDEDNLSVLLDLLGASLVIKIFGSLLLERKVIIISNELSTLSSCMEALQSSLYPLVWQQPLISCIPSAIQNDVLEAPLPILAGMLTSKSWDSTITEGMLIDLTNPSKVLHCQGDESTILPSSSYRTLKTALQMESIKYKDRSEDWTTRNVMISEAFLRFFVDILGDFWRFFTEGEVKDGALGKGGIVFDKEAFTKSATSKQNQYFLEWFTETAMFNHFIQNMAVCHRASAISSTDGDSDLVDAPLPKFYQLFEDRVRSRTKLDSRKGTDTKNYKSAVNLKVKLLKSKLRDLIT